jgi:hypothetical protein
MNPTNQTKEQTDSLKIVFYCSDLNWKLDYEFIRNEGLQAKEKLDTFYRSIYNYANFFPIKYNRLVKLRLSLPEVSLHGIALAYWLCNKKCKAKPHIIIYYENESEDDVINKWSFIKSFITEDLVDRTISFCPTEIDETEDEMPTIAYGFPVQYNGKICC